MLIIKVKPGESVDYALKRYKRKIKQTQILKEVRGRKHYIKPSERNREIIKKAQRREAYLIKEAI